MTPSFDSLEPFGAPDGSRADIEDLQRDFVAFARADDEFGGLAIQPGDLRARVFVGKKGAGKTLYLRRARAFAAADLSLFADDIQQDLPTTTQIARVCSWYAPAVLTEVWMSVWRAAILKSLASHICYNQRLATDKTQEFRDGLLRDYRRLLPRQKDPMSVYSQVRVLINSAKSGTQLHRLLTNDDWDGLEHRLASFMHDLPPLFMYLDAVDEEFRHAPTFWLMCQKGLFYQVMRLLRDSRFGGRLHLVICIRDLVFSSIMQSEHMTRYVNWRHIRLLEWGPRAIRHLLREKVSRLDDRWLLAAEADDLLERWLGGRYVWNERKRVDEPLETYLIRHTRLIPRDIVILGNALHQRVLQAKADGLRALNYEDIRRTVSSVALLFGREQLAICANQIAIGELPEEQADLAFGELWTGEHPAGRQAEADIAPGIVFSAARGRYVYKGLDVYDGDNPGLLATAFYQGGLVDDLAEFVKSLGADRLSQVTFKEALHAADRRFPQSGLMSVLWQNGLLGYSEGDLLTGQGRFYCASKADPLDIPTDRPTYVLHPCLIDTLGITGVGAPVVPNLGVQSL